MHGVDAFAHPIATLPVPIGGISPRPCETASKLREIGFGCGATVDLIVAKQIIWSHSSAKAPKGIS
jgi:hypothetical protein